ncbi:hypothetical protein ACWEOG_22150 [Amycolatopsis japonica]
MTASTSLPPRSDSGALPPLTARWRRLWKRPGLRHYNRLIVGVLAVNGLILWWTLAESRLDLAGLSYLAQANIAFATFVRAQYMINFFFRVATWPSTRWPLRIRWTLGKVYHFGGLHVGAAIAGTLWFLAYTVTLGLSVGSDSAPAMAISVAASTALAAVVITALPPLRAKQHNMFEQVHRFGGWTALALFWCQALVSAAARPGPFLETPTFWILLFITAHVALPWLRLRRVPVAIKRPSSHVALVEFDHGVTPFAGSATGVSLRPWREWHSFANVPAPGRTGFRLTISRAGDWTGAFIDAMPSHVWVKGIPTAGVANIETLFTRVVYVATGSGIGPCLPHLLAKEVPSILVWATRDPRVTYGDELLDEILAVQPDATIWDTSRQGKPDMVKMAYDAYRAFGAEAVICISNKKLTWEVVHGLEARGIPAFGAIWDS